MANQPSFIPSAWAANNSTTETIPATTTESGKASWDQGFPVETSLPLSEGGIPPKYGDFNGILNVLSQFCVFAQAGGQFTWSNSLAYSVGSIVVGSDGSIYRAVQATTNVNPVGDTSGKWERIVSQSDIAALEADIHTAMTNASDAVSNASAAQSAVSTLDANVVKLSGDQTVGGTKTFSDTIVESNDTASMKRPNTMGALRMTGGTNTSDTGAILSLFGADNSNQAGYFQVYAVKDANTATLLEGRPDGTLTWGGSNVNTAAKPGVQLVEVGYNNSVRIVADGQERIYFTPPTIAGYTASRVVSGRGNGTLGFVVPCWIDADNAWVMNCRPSAQTATSLTFLVEYVRN